MDTTSAPFDAALFDLDGTLVETERVLYKAWIELAKRAGADFLTFDYANIIGKPDVDCCRIVSEHFGLGRDPQAWYEEYRVIALDMMDRDLELRPGTEAVLARLSALGVPRAVVTSGTREHAEKALGKFGLVPAFNVLVTADSPGLAARKPDPAPYLLGARLLGVDAARCVAFEDSPAGVRSAVAAGCKVFAIPHALSPMANLREAHVILASLADFRPETVHLL
ncbi:MAG TPA: HAD family phosphatase [Candidatus Eisenbacteria bacterium]|nr:HAD family phosphatase [Candidatus Eisenbacteria bacterium]